MLPTALQNHLINPAQAHAIDYKRPMLNMTSFWVVSLIYFAIWGFYMMLLNAGRCSAMRVRRSRESRATRRTGEKFENVSGAGVVIYALTLTAAAIYWVMSLDLTWYSSVYGLLFLVGQGYGVLALAVLTVIALSKDEPMQDDPAR